MGVPPARSLMNAEDIHTCLERLADEISSRHTADGAQLALIGIQRRGVHLARRLGRLLRQRLGVSLPEGVLDINLYRDDWTTLGPRAVVGRTALDFAVQGRIILLVDDVLYTGRTVRAAMEALADYGRPRKMELVVLADRGGRELPIHADYVAERIVAGPDERVDVLLEEQDGRDEVLLRKKNS